MREQPKPISTRSMINHIVQNINQGPRRNVYQSQQYTKP
jgi:hypothetical protein